MNILNIFANATGLTQFIDAAAERIASRILQTKARSDLSDTGEETTYRPARKEITDYFSEMRAESARNQMALAGWRAYMGDPRIAAQIDGNAEHATAADNEGRVVWLSLNTTEEEDSATHASYEMLEERMRALRLGNIAPQIIKRMLIEGDAFREVVANVQRDTVVRFQEIPGAREGFIMRKLEDPETGEQTGWALYSTFDGKPVRVFAPWQVVQFSWNRFGNYGTPLLGAVKLDFERTLQMEESMFAARQERAYVKFAHIFEGFTEEQLRAVRIADEAASRRRGKGVSTNFYVNKDMKMFDPSNAQLANIDDVKHVEDKMLTGGRFPKGFLGGYGEQINRAVLEKQEEGLIRFLSKLNAIVSDGFRELMDTQLLMRNTLPEDVPYSFIWTEKKVDDFKSTVEALGLAVEKLQISPPSAMEELGFDPDEELERWIDWENRMSEARAQIDDGVEDRIAGELAAMRSVMARNNPEANNGGGGNNGSNGRPAPNRTQESEPGARWRF